MSGVCGEIPKEASLTGQATFVIEFPSDPASGTITAIAFGSHQLVGRDPLPEIDAIRLKEFASRPAKQADQFLGRSTLSGRVRKFEQKALKRDVRAGIVVLHRHVLSRLGQGVTAHPLSIHK